MIASLIITVGKERETSNCNTCFGIKEIASHIPTVVFIYFLILGFFGKLAHTIQNSVPREEVLAKYFNLIS